MRNVAAIAGKEMRSYFVSPIAYVVTAMFLIAMGYFFAVPLLYSGSATVGDLFSNIFVILMFLIAPLLTMRLLAEEQNSGTIELLLTAPVRDAEVVVGKFLASLGTFGVMLALTLFYPLLLFIYGQPDGGPILATYIGAFLVGAGFLAVGMFTSSLTKNQIVAAMLSFGALLLLWVIDWVSSFVDPSVGGVLSYLSLYNHFPDFTKGIVDVKDLVYYASIIAVFLFLTVRSLETRRWR